MNIAASVFRGPRCGSRSVITFDERILAIRLFFPSISTDIVLSKSIILTAYHLRWAMPGHLFARAVEISIPADVQNNSLWRQKRVAEWGNYIIQTGLLFLGFQIAMFRVKTSRQDILST
jgi:hypothetical protein